MKNVAGVDKKAHLSDGRGGVSGAKKRTIGPETNQAGKMKSGGRKQRSRKV